MRDVKKKEKGGGQRQIEKAAKIEKKSF